MLCCAAVRDHHDGRAKTEESAGRTEFALANPVSRTRWFGAPLLVAGTGTLVLLAVSLYALWAGTVSVGWDTQAFGDYTTVIVTHAPALAVSVGLTAALFAWFPRAGGLGTPGVHVPGWYVRWDVRSARVGTSSLTLHLGSHPVRQERPGRGDGVTLEQRCGAAGHSDRRFLPARRRQLTCRRPGTAMRSTREDVSLHAVTPV